jgi:hypothetical protein
VGQVTRNIRPIKTRADTGLNLGGIIGAGARAGASAGLKTRAGATAGLTRNIRPILPSKPVPPPTAAFIGFTPRPTSAPASIGAGIGAATGIGSAGFGGAGTVGRTGVRAGPAATGLPDYGGFAGKPVQRHPSFAPEVGTADGGAGVNGSELDRGPKAGDPSWNSFDALSKGAGRVLQGVGVGATQGVKKKREAAAKEPNPDDKVLADLELQVSSALRDNAWSPETRAKIVQTYRDFWLHYTGADPQRMELNNYAIQSEYRRYLQQWHDNGQNGKHTADWGNGDFFSTYSGTLDSEANDAYGPGFVLDKDPDGWFKITNVQDLQAQIEASMRKDPVAAAEMITRLTAWGAYGGAQEKYSRNNVVLDKNGNPVKARWTKDDQVALSQFLHDVSKQQEAAKDGSELQPWQDILVTVSTQNQGIATTPGYGGDSSGGGGYSRRGYGGGGYGGGGGGGGISYTDSDQLKQLINAIARARLGYALNDDQIGEFVTEYHNKEAAFVNARIAGQSGQQLDPESQAAAWIESHFRDQMAGQQGNTYISALANFLMNGSFGSTS